MGKKFNGTIGRTMRETQYSYEITQDCPQGAPNVVYILIDDMGFSHLGCYGSDIDTPHIDRLASEGLRYNNFHTTAICSATRASLLTGANHHKVGCASLIEMQTGTGNGIGRIKSEYATIAEILKEYGYATFCSGKWHLANAKTQAGPYDGWPIQKGFDRYYGFLHGENDQYHPHLIRDNYLLTQEEVSAKVDKPGYHFSEDIVDNAIENIFTQKNAFPQQPFFLYLAFGAMHTPHHAPKEYIDRYKGKFDEGWDVKREKWFRHQKELGIVPSNAELTDRNEYVESWESLSADQKRAYARLMEAYAGMLTHLDDQVGRLTDYLEEIGELDNTVIVLLADNGASGEGGKDGRLNAFKGQDIIFTSNEVEKVLAHYDEIGTEYAFNHYPTGWANAGNTPFQWYKVWTHEGGVKDPLIIRYPKAIREAGGIRGQYSHVSDITPTILDIIGVKKPAFIKGVAQADFTGISFKYTFEDKEAESRKKVQYFEIHGNRAIYKDGWKAVVNHTLSSSYADDKWELYHVTEDYSEKYDVSAQYPEKLKELQEEWLIEAAKNEVFPMLQKSFHASYEAPQISMYGKIPSPEKNFEFRGIFRPYDIAESNGINFDTTHTLTANIFRDSKATEGVILATGDRFSGFTFYIRDNKLKYVYNYAAEEYYTAESDIELPEGDVEVKYAFIRRNGVDELPTDLHGVHKTGSLGTAEAILFVNSKEVGRTNIRELYYMKGFSTTIRADKYTPVSSEYEVPFEFTGKIKKVTIHQAASTINIEEEIDRFLNQE